jgi:hypothetical protein
MGVATAIAGSAIIGGVVASSSAKKAASAQKSAANTAAETSEAGLQQQREIFDQITEQTRPARQVGGQALNNLAVLFGLEPALPEGVSGEQAVQAQIAREQPMPTPQEQQQAPAAPTPAPMQTINTPFGQIQIPANIQEIMENARNNAGQATAERPTTRFQNLAGLPGMQNQPVNVGNPQQVLAGPASLAAPTAQGPVGPTANSPTTPIAGQQTQLQQTGFLDSPNQAAPTRAGVLQNLRDFPVSRFLQEEGMRGIQGSAAAGGNLQSGRTLKGLVQFNQNLAQAQSIQPFIGGLQSLAGVGQTAGNTQANNAAGLSGAIGQNAANIGNAQLAGGAARASAFQGTNQAVQGTLSNLLQFGLLRDAGVF